MFDPVNASLQAIGAGSPLAATLVFCAGVASSVGPCMAPRLVAVAGVLANRRGRSAWVTILAFVVGLIVAYASFGLFASMLVQMVALSREIYFSVGIALLVGGVAILLRRSNHECDHAQSRERGSLGAVFLLGASFAFVIAPCCAPVVLGILAFCMQAHSPAYGAVLLGIFALGHAVPVFLVGSGTVSLSTQMLRWKLQDPSEVVAGVLMLALAGYYLCLA